MQKILLPTDFSEHSRASALYAAQMAHLMNARLDIAHVTDIVPSVGIYESAQQLTDQKLRGAFNALVKAMEEAVGESFAYETFILSGTTTSTLAALAERYELVVMSSKGEVDLDRFFLGSTTKYLIQQNQAPILVVPPAYTFKKIEKVVWALDSHEVTTFKQIHPLPVIASHFNAKVEIFHHDEGPGEEGLQLDLAIFLEDIEYSIHYDFGNANIIDAILDFAQDAKSDLIAMIHHPRNLLLQFINPSKTLNSISKSKTPLLVLPERRGE